MALRLFGFDRVLIWSAVFGAAIVAGFALIGPETPHWFIIVYVFVFGLSRAAQFMTSNTLSYSDTPAAQLSSRHEPRRCAAAVEVSASVSPSPPCCLAWSHWMAHR